MTKRDAYSNVQVAIGGASVLVGLLLVLAPGTALFAGYERTIAEAFWGSADLTPEARSLSHWLLATCGAGVVGWGIAWMAIAHIPLRAGERWAWLTLLVSLTVWVASDVAVALWFGVTGEVIFVVAALVAAATPLLLSSRLYPQKVGR